MQIVAALIYEFLWNHLVDFFWMCPAKFEGFAPFHLLPDLLCQGGL